MESHVYAVLFQFNQGVETALDALNKLEKMSLETPEYVQQIRVRIQETAANANSRFTNRISKRETDEQLQNEQERRKQELREEDRPNRTKNFLRLKDPNFERSPSPTGQAALGSLGRRENRRREHATFSRSS
jgi:hypothetical protein